MEIWNRLLLIGKRHVRWQSSNHVLHQMVEISVDYLCGNEVGLL
jgi:hypothetical protein